MRIVRIMAKSVKCTSGSSLCLEGVEDVFQYWSIPHDPNDDDVNADGDETANIGVGQLKIWWNCHCTVEGARRLVVLAKVHCLQMYTARW